MTTFIGSNGDDTILPGLTTPGVTTIGPDATPGGGDDLIIGRAGNDIVAGGRGSDVAVLGAGDDAFLWAPADGNDTVFGQSGFDRLVLDGDDSGEVFRLFQAGDETRLDRNFGAATVRLTGVERVELLAGAGQDFIEVGDLSGGTVGELGIDLGPERGAFAGDGAEDIVTLRAGHEGASVTIFGAAGETLISGLPVFTNVLNAEAHDTLAVLGGRGNDDIAVTGAGGGPRLALDGGAGDDTLSGGDGNDLLIGGRGDDLVTGGGGDDVARLGTGSDRFFWADGDGNDTVDGGDGQDVLRFDGGAANETISLAAEGRRAMLARDVGEVTMRIDNIESITILAGDGTDRIEIGDLGRTDVGSVDVSLSAPGRYGDGAADEVFVSGGRAIDDIIIGSGSDSSLWIAGLSAEVLLSDVEAEDTLTISGGAGRDGLNANDVRPGQVRLILDGGAGRDFIFGSGGDDTILGGDGGDRLSAGAGDDWVWGGSGDEIAVLGRGDDVFAWRPGEGNDSIIGDEGTDTLAFDGSAEGEVIEIAAGGSDTTLLRDVGGVRMDLEAVERIALRLFGGTDEVVVRDVGVTDLAEVVIDLSGPDGAADLVVVEGTEGRDDVTISVDGDAIMVEGLSATIRILGAEDGLDQLLFRGFGGDDRIDASSLKGIGLSVQAGAGDDVILGSLWADRLSGDAGDDVLLAGGGDDTVFGGEGEDLLDGGAGLDQLLGDARDVFLGGEIVDSGFFL